MLHWVVSYFLTISSRHTSNCPTADRESKTPSGTIGLENMRSLSFSDYKQEIGDVTSTKLDCCKKQWSWIQSRVLYGQ